MMSVVQIRIYYFGAVILLTRFTTKVTYNISFDRDDLGFYELIIKWNELLTPLKALGV